MLTSQIKKHSFATEPQGLVMIRFVGYQASWHTWQFWCCHHELFIPHTRRVLTRKLIYLEFEQSMLVETLKTFYWRHTDLVGKYTSVSAMIDSVFTDNRQCVDHEIQNVIMGKMAPDTASGLGSFLRLIEFSFCFTLCCEF